MSWSEMLRARLRLAILALFSLPPILFGAWSPSASSDTSSRGAIYAIILGAGLIGRPAASGTLALLLSRPVPRSSYVLTRWVAAWWAAAGLAIAVQIVLALEAARFGPVDWRALGISCLENLLSAAGIAAVLVFLSSF